MSEYLYQLFIIIRRTRKQDFIDWVRSHPNAAAKLGLDVVVESEGVKITTIPRPNSAAPVQVLGSASWITSEQRDFWIQVKDLVPVAWQGDIEGAIRRLDNRLDFDEWLASQSTPLYRIIEDE